MYACKLQEVRLSCSKGEGALFPIKEQGFILGPEKTVGEYYKVTC